LKTIKKHSRRTDTRPVFIKEPFGLPKELQPTGKFRRTPRLTKKKIKTKRISTSTINRRLRKLEEERSNTFDAQNKVRSRFVKQNPFLNTVSQVSIDGYLSGFFKNKKVKPDPLLFDEFKRIARKRRDIVDEVFRLEKLKQNNL